MKTASIPDVVQIKGEQFIDDCRTLARIAGVLGETGDEERLLRRADALSARIDERLWDEERGTYLNRDWDGRFSPTLSLTHFYPLLSGDVPEPRVDRLLNDHLLDPSEFWTTYVVPTVPKSDPAFEQQAYWRGRVWGPTNFLVTEGCRRCGRDEVAARIAARGLDLLLVGWRERGAVCENYNAIAGVGRGDDRNDPFYTWGALLSYICIQEYFDAQVWSDEIKLGSDHGSPGTTLRNVPFRGRKLNITSGARAGVQVTGQTTVRTTDGAVVSRHDGALRLSAVSVAERTSGT